MREDLSSMDGGGRETVGAGHVHQTLILLATCSATTLIFATTVAVATSLPAIGADLGATQSQLQWVADSYALVLAALLLPAGALLDRYGRKRGLIVGLVVLGAGLLWSGVPADPNQLILSRCLAGVGAALAFPATLATITTAIAPARRDRAVAVWSASTVGGGVIGVVLGGALTELWGWQAGPLVLAGLVGACLVLSVAVVPETRDPGHAHLDPLGALLAVVGVGGFAFGVTEGPVRGWTDSIVLGALGLGVAAVIAFVRWEMRNPRPLIQLRLFADRAFACSTMAVLVSFVACFGTLFLGIYYGAFVLGYGSFETGLSICPAVVIIPAAVMTPALVRRFGRRMVIGTGLAVMAAAAALLAVTAGTETYWLEAIGVALTAAGAGLAMTPATAVIVQSLPSAEQGVASAVNDTARELGTAIGVAVYASVFNSSYRGRVGDLMASSPRQLVDVVESGPAAGLETAAHLGSAARSTVEIVRTGTIAGVRAGSLVGAAIIGGAAIYVMRYFPSHRRAREAGSARPAPPATIDLRSLVSAAEGPPRNGSGVGRVESVPAPHTRNHKPGRTHIQVETSLEPNGSVRFAGTVCDDDGRPVPKALVSVIDANGALVAFTPTSAQGAYSVDGLTPARYTLVASYQLASFTVDLAGVATGTTAPAEIALSLDGSSQVLRFELLVEGDVAPNSHSQLQEDGAPR